MGEKTIRNGALNKLSSAFKIAEIESKPLSVFLRRANPGLFFVYFYLFVQKTVIDVRKTQTRINGVQGEDANHLTNSTASIVFVFVDAAIGVVVTVAVLVASVCLASRKLMVHY